MSAEWERKKLCFMMLQMWSSEGMRRSRVDAWRTLTDEGLAASRGPIDTRVLKENEPEYYAQIAAVCHFFRDLDVLVKEQVVDPGLAKKLFWDDIQSWLRYLDRVKFATTSTQQWYDSEVKSIRATFESIQ